MTPAPATVQIDKLACCWGQGCAWEAKFPTSLFLLKEQARAFLQGCPTFRKSPGAQHRALYKAAAPGFLNEYKPQAAEEICPGERQCPR